MTIHFFRVSKGVCPMTATMYERSSNHLDKKQKKENDHKNKIESSRIKEVLSAPPKDKS